MTLFARILGAKKAADAHQKAVQEATAPKPVDVQPYRHIPTHAKTDSLNLAISLHSPDFHERIRAESRRGSRVALSRTASDTSLDHRSMLEQRRATRGVAPLVSRQANEIQAGQRKDLVDSLAAQKGARLAPTSNPYAMSPMPSPRGGKSPAGSMSPAGSVRSTPISPLASSTTEEEPEAYCETPGATPETRLGDDERIGFQTMVTF